MTGTLYIYNSSLNSSYKQKMFQTKFVRKIKTHFMFTILFSKIVAFVR